MERSSATSDLHDPNDLTPVWPSGVVRQHVRNRIDHRTLRRSDQGVLAPVPGASQYRTISGRSRASSAAVPCWCRRVASLEPLANTVERRASGGCERSSQPGALPCPRGATRLRLHRKQRSTELVAALAAHQDRESFRHDYERAGSITKRPTRPDRWRERGARDCTRPKRQGAITAAAVDPHTVAACLTAGAWRSIDFGIAQTTPFIFATEMYLAGLAG